MHTNIIKREDPLQIEHDNLPQFPKELLLIIFSRSMKPLLIFKTYAEPLPIYKILFLPPVFTILDPYNVPAPHRYTTILSSHPFHLLTPCALFFPV